MAAPRISDQDPTRLVAKFLLTHGYLDTLQALTHESSISLEDFCLDDEEGEQVTLESLLEDRRLRELSNAMAKARLAESEISGWGEQCPAIFKALPLKSPTNVLFVTAEKVLGEWSILVTTADRALRIYNYKTLDLEHEYTFLHTSPILEARVLKEKWLLTAGMDGKVVVSDLTNKAVVIASLENAHTRYVNRLVIQDSWIATSGYDKKINLYEITACTDSEIVINYKSSITLATTPEGMLFTEHEGSTVLVVIARDTCFLEYYCLPSLSPKQKFNLNQNGDMWVSFSGIDIAQQPTGPKYIGMSTSTTPHGRWLAFEVGKEDLKANIFHGSPQSDLGVLPRFAWRPDGSGFWVSTAIYVPVSKTNTARVYRTIVKQM